MSKKLIATDLSSSIEKLIRNHLENQQHEVAQAVARAFGKTTAMKTNGIIRRAPRRSREELETLSHRLLAAIKSKPGESMRVLSNDMGESAAALVRPSAFLKKRKQIKTVGKCSLMRYFPLS